MSTEELVKHEREDPCLALADLVRNDMSVIRGMLYDSQKAFELALHRVQGTMDGLQALIDDARSRVLPQLIDPAGSYEIRSDPAGDGHYYAARGNRWHLGIDTLADPGDSARAPMSGVLVRSGLCYRDDDRWSLAVIECEPWECKVLYVAPFARLVGRCVRMGQTIGLVQNVTKRKDYAAQGMNPHVHTEIREHGGVVDPTPLMGLCNDRS